MKKKKAHGSSQKETDHIYVYINVWYIHTYILYVCMYVCMYVCVNIIIIIIYGKGGAMSYG